MNALDVVLTPPQRDRLAKLLGLPDLSSVELTGEGWHRYAVLTDDRVALLPRNHLWVPGLEREAVALDFLRGRGLPVPELLCRVEDPVLWPYPVSIVSRYAARPWSALQESADLERTADLLADLGRLIAGYHKINIAELPAAIAAPVAASPSPFEAALPHFSDYLEPSRLGQQGRALAIAADLPTRRVERWLEVIGPCLQLPPVLVHRDINEGQIMIDSDGRIAGLIDWESVGVGHPLSDFDLGEWGFGIFAWERDFALLRRTFWESYVAERGIDAPDWRAVHLLMTIINAPAPEGSATAWFASRRERTLINLREIDAKI